MPVSGGGFEQAYNAHASVDMDKMLIVGNQIGKNPNDKQEVEPALTQLNQLPETLGQVNRAALDSGFFSEDNAQRLSENEIEARAQAKYDRGKDEYEAKLKERAAKEKARGRKLGGKQPKAPEAGPKAKDQVNFTDSESRIMPTSVGGFEQAYNAHAGRGYGHDADCGQPDREKPQRQTRSRTSVGSTQPTA